MMHRLRTWGISTLALGLGLMMGACDDPTDLDLDPPVVSVAVAPDESGLVVAWSAVAGAESYTVRRQTVGATGGYATLAGDLSETEYADLTAVQGNTYSYVVQAVADGEVSNSEAAAFSWGLEVANLSGELGNRTLSADTTYYLQGTVTVPAGVTLTIEPGTLILGDLNVQPTALIIRQGGFIDAQGTADAPIVFTSSAEVGSRARGQWGGIVINGYGICNFPDADDCVAEGFPATYGGDVEDDSSGVMTYVRIEYAGYEVSAGNELNALTLNGVGSRTVLHHIQTHMGLDDGFEWFGGSVSLKYALATGISDDSFDYSTGWNGNGQFWIAQQDPNDADTGFEVDNNGSDPDALPRTAPAIYNVTLVGKEGGTGGTAGESTRGLHLRLGTAGTIANAIVMGFGSSGLDIDDAETVDQCTTGALTVASTIFFANAVWFDGDEDAHEATCTGAAGWDDLLETDPQLGDPFNRAAPDFQPAAASPAANAANAAANPGGWFTPAEYLGAVDPAATGPLWYEGWTTFENN